MAQQRRSGLPPNFFQLIKKWASRTFGLPPKLALANGQLILGQIYGVYWAFFGGYTKELLTDETITAIAGAHGVSAAQVILRWDLQRSVSVIPGSSNPDQIRENLDLFGFELTPEEMDRIAALDRGEKHDWY